MYVCVWVCMDVCVGVGVGMRMKVCNVRIGKKSGRNREGRTKGKSDASRRVSIITHARSGMDRNMPNTHFKRKLSTKKQTAKPRTKQTKKDDNETRKMQRMHERGKNDLSHTLLRFS